MKQLKSILLLALVMFIAVGTINAQQKKKRTKPRTQAQLTDTYWKLYEMNGKSVVTPADAMEAHIKLKGNKKMELEGNGGCNMITGNYKLGKETLSFEAATTLRACNDMAVESYLLNALEKTDRYEINGLYLLLYNGTYLLAVFEAKYYDEE